MCKVKFKLDSLSLEGILYLPEAKEKLPAVIVCHPHPQFGGSMDNNVVNAVCEGLYNEGIATLKFNFRGVGKSEGKSTGGREEDKDIIAAHQYLISRTEIDKEKMGVVGYSFGAYVGLRAGVKEQRFKLLLGISPPLTFFDFSFLKEDTNLKFFILGDSDTFVPYLEFKNFFDGLKEPKFYKVIKDADHIWLGKEEELKEVVVKFIKDNL